MLTGLLGAALIALVVFLLVKRFRGKRQSGGKRVPAEPPHVTAIRQLEKLHSQKLWQSGKQKAYYTGITDILREYLSTRYPVKALEMTSQEILDRMIRESLPEKSIKRLKDILITADFVKFAKFTPDADQNETVYTDAYYFIEETKAVEVEQPAVEIEPIKTEEKKEDDA